MAAIKIAVLVAGEALGVSTFGVSAQDPPKSSPGIGVAGPPIRHP